MAGDRRFLVVAFDAGGNAPPALGLVRLLVDRGHDVRVLGPASLEARTLGAGCAFEALRRVPDWDAQPAQAIEDELASFVDFLFGRRIADEVLAVVEREVPDCVVADCMLGGVLAALEKASVPCASLVHFLY